MKAAGMKLGAEPGKLALLGALVVLAGVVLYMNVFAGSSDAPGPVAAVPSAAVPSVAPVVAGSVVRAPERRRVASNGAVSEFKPRVGPVRLEDRPDPATVDPTLRLDLLAKLQAVEPGGALRNVFQYGSAPPPPKPVELPKNVPKIPINQPPPVTAPPPGPPPPPPAPPITLKYYGFKVAKLSGRKEAFLLDGDDIIIAGENDEMKRGRYRVVRIGVNSITIEDTQFKNTQTIPLEEGVTG